MILGIGIPFGRRGGIDPQAQAAFNSLIAAGFTCPQGLIGINAAFKTIKTIYGTSDITTAISFFGDPALSYQLGTGSGTTLGQAIRTLPNLVDATRATDAVQTTAASQPLLLVHSGDNYFFNPLSQGSNCQTPNSPANQITGDIDIKVNFDIASYFFNTFLAKVSGGSNLQYLFRALGGGVSTNLNFRFSINGSTWIDVNSTDNIANTIKWVRVTRISSNGNVTFFTSIDGINWTQLGSIVTSTSGSLFNGTAPLTIANNNSSGTDGFGGKIYRATISNSIGGAPVVDFNPNQYNPATSQTQWTSSSGEIWTINKSSGNTFVGVLVYQNIIQGNNTTTSLPTTITLTQPATEYLSANRNGSGNFIERATGNSRSHNGTNATLNNGSALNAANANSTRQVFTFRSNGASSGIAINNGTETTGDAGANNGTTMVLCQGAHNVVTVIQTKQNDTAPQRTDMFNFIKASSKI